MSSPLWDACTLVPAEMGYEVAALLYDEAAVLDERRFEDWLALTAEDLRYRMPVRSIRSHRDQAREIGGPGDVAHFDEDRRSFAMRIRRLGAHNAWSENPSSRVRRFVSNIVVRSHDDFPDLVLARSYVSVYRSRLDDETGRITAGRLDVWRRRQSAPGWELVSRELTTDDVVLEIGNLSFWF